MDPKLCVLLLFRLNILLKAADIYIFFFASEAFNRGPVFPLLEFYSICSYSIHVQLLNGHWSPIQVLTVAQVAYPQ